MYIFILVIVSDFFAGLFLGLTICILLRSSFFKKLTQLSFVPYYILLLLSTCLTNAIGIMKYVVYCLCKCCELSLPTFLFQISELNNFCSKAFTEMLKMICRTKPIAASVVFVKLSNSQTILRRQTKAL